ncbi:MAG TPA: alkene reductase [Aliidongia sp.]|nr:alkene reductase [Aliidongia sp.]
MAGLFDPITIGELKLPNRVFMAPLTRSRAGDSRVPNDLMRDYYVQRASAGLIISEATSVSAMGVGYAGTPGIWSPAQTAAWREVTRGVHEAGGRIFLQLWHVGRISDPSFLGNQPPVAPSAIAAKGHVSLLRPERPFPLPRALETTEIPGIVEEFRRGAQNAESAGFDGVEIHGANGYLLDQFLHDGANHRTDQYGGSIENRARFMLEITDAVVSVWGAGRVGMHLSPRSDFHDVTDSQNEALFLHVAKELGRRKLGFICAREYAAADSLGPSLKTAFGGAYVVNEKFTGETAAKALADGTADAVAFGKDFISNPDLPQRLKAGQKLTEWNPATFYSSGPEGYVDYEALDPALVS